MNLEPLLSAVRRRTAHRGISTAAPFLRELTACLGGVCPSRVLGDVSRDGWATMLKEAESRLVYHADDMALGDRGAGILTLPETAGGTPAPQRAGGTPAPQSLQLPPHTIATFPAVITTTRQDRDGDVLETKGAELDPAAPLLWQHLPTEPIGRLLKEGMRTKSSLMGSFAVAGTALGHDAALLAEHGALRISHGFLPERFEPLDEKDVFSGFHVTAFKILEVSLVSVPSNPDAVITQFSREKLSHPLVKAWAGAKFRERPVQVVSRGVVSGGVVRPTAVEAGGFTTHHSTTHNSPTPVPLTTHDSPLTFPPTRRANAVDVEPKRKDPPTQWCLKMLKKSLGHCAAIAANPDATTLIADEATKAQGHIQDVIETLDPKDKVSSGVVSDEHPSRPQAVPLTPHDSQLTKTFSAANERKLLAAAAHYKAIAHDDDAHPEVADLAHSRRS